MIKTLFASLCVVACCVGNDYPAKAGCSDNSWGGREYCEISEESGRAMQRRYREVVRDAELHQLRQKIYNPSY